jgi:hypothetical protein
LPLLPRRNSASWNLFSLAINEVLMLVGETLRLRYGFQILWRLLLVTGLLPPEVVSPTEAV